VAEHELDSSEPYDIAIVGAGVSGAYCAWRLSVLSPDEAARLKERLGVATDGPLRVALFEGSKRFGGRLMSVQMPDMPHACELGGMRYSSEHRLVRWLVEEQFRLKTRPLPVDRDDNIAYLRGKRFRRWELRDSSRLPYQLAPQEWGKPPDALLNAAFHQILPNIDTWRPKRDDLWEELLRREFKRVPLRDWGIWVLLAHVMSPEAYRLARDAGGYDTPTRNWNAVSGIALNYEFQPEPGHAEPAFKGIVEGFQTVPMKLVEQAQEKGGVKVCREWTLKSFDWKDPAIGGDGLVHLAFDGPQTKPVRARRLILAMPKRSLELVTDETNKVIRDDDLRWVTPVPLFKGFLRYSDAWWNRAGVLPGRSVTDMPIRQCYYWDVNDAGQGTLMVYDDALMADFWAGLKSAAELSWTWLMQEPDVLALLDSPPPASYEIVTLLQDQLRRLHGLDEIAAPTHAVWFDWKREPFGGGVNFWNVGADLASLLPKMLHPELHIPVYICGEAFSANQGWVEGALETAEAILHTHLGLALPQISAGGQPRTSNYELPRIYCGFGANGA
jgi:flavin-dependent amine oxidoreductase